MVWGVSARRRKRLLHFRRISEGTGRKGRELSCLQKVRRIRGCPVHLYTSLPASPALDCAWFSMMIRVSYHGQVPGLWLLRSADGFTGGSTWHFSLLWFLSVQCLSRAMLLLVEETLMSFLVGDTLFQQGWWLWMQGLEQVFSSLWHLRIWLHFYLIDCFLSITIFCMLQLILVFHFIKDMSRVFLLFGF